MALNRAAKFGLALCLTALLPLAAAAGSPSPAPKPKDAAEKKTDSKPAAEKKKAAKPEPTKVVTPASVVLASVRYNRQWVLTRIDQKLTPLLDDKGKPVKIKRVAQFDASFERSYLSQSEGSFLSFPPFNNQGDDFGAQVSPDGSTVAFFSSRTGAANLWLMDSNGGNQRQVTISDVDILPFDANQDGRLRFSPDGNNVAFVMLGRAWKYDLKINTLTTLSNQTGVTCLDWSQDGKFLVYVTGNSVRRVTSAGTDDHLVVADAVRWPSLQTSQAAKKNKPNEFLYVGNGIYKGDAETRESEFVVDSTVVPNQPRYSPDENSIAFLAESPDFKRELFLLSFSGKKRKKDDTGSDAEQITRGGASFPVFAPSGKSLYFLRNGNLWVIKTDGSEPRVLTHFETVLPTAATMLPLEGRR